MAAPLVPRLFQGHKVVWLRNLALQFPGDSSLLPFGGAVSPITNYGTHRTQPKSCFKNSHKRRRTREKLIPDWKSPQGWNFKSLLKVKGKNFFAFKFCNRIPFPFRSILSFCRSSEMLLYLYYEAAAVDLSSLWLHPSFPSSTVDLTFYARDDAAAAAEHQISLQRVARRPK